MLNSEFGIRNPEFPLGHTEAISEFGIWNCCRPPADASHRRLRAAHSLLLEMRPDPPQLPPAGSELPHNHPLSKYVLNGGRVNLASDDQPFKRA